MKSMVEDSWAFSPQRRRMAAGHLDTSFDGNVARLRG
jgi:hypothetical protein